MSSEFIGFRSSAHQMPFVLNGSSVVDRMQAVVVKPEQHMSNNFMTNVQVFSMRQSTCSTFGGQVQTLFAVSGSTPDTQCVGTGTAVAAVFDPIADLHLVVSAIIEARPLPPATPSFDELLSRVEASRGRPTDIAAWAQQLADDIGDLTD